MKNRTLTLSLALFMLGASSSIIAKPINLYDQPKADGKVIGTIDSSAGIITIFTPKDTGWVKVADPRNGNVGWIKSTELNGVNTQFNVIQTGDGQHGYQIIQYGNTMTPDQISNMTKQMQLQQQTIQNDMNKMMRDMFNNSHQYWMSVPMMVPVVVMPVNNANPPQPSKPAPEKK